MPSTKAAMGLLFSGLFWATAALAQTAEHPTITFINPDSRAAQPATVENVDEYLYNKEELEVQISSTLILNKELKSIIIAFDDHQKTLALREAVMNNSKISFVVSQSDLMQPTRHRTDSAWVSPDHVKVVYENGATQSAADVAKQNSSLVEAKYGVYPSSLSGVLRMQFDEYNCEGYFAKHSMHCQFSNYLGNH